MSKAKVHPKTVSFLIRVGDLAHKATVQRFECPAHLIMHECPQEGAVVSPGKHLCKDFCHAKMSAKD